MFGAGGRQPIHVVNACKRTLGQCISVTGFFGRLEAGWDELGNPIYIRLDVQKSLPGR